MGIFAPAMKLDELKRAVAAGRLRFGFIRSVKHHISVWVTAAVACYVLAGVSNIFVPGFGIWIVPLPFFAAIAGSYYLNRQLRFVSADTKLSPNAAFAVVERVIEHEAWTVKKRTKKLLICQSIDNCLVTIVIYSGRVHVASHSVPEALFPWAQIVTNEINVNKVIGQIKRAELNPDFLAIK